MCTSEIFAPKKEIEVFLYNDLQLDFDSFVVVAVLRLRS